MSCKISIKNTGVVKALSNVLGNRNVDIIKYLSEVLEDDTHFNHAFSEYYYSHNGQFPDIKSNTKVLADAIIAFYNTKHLNVAELAKDVKGNNFITNYGYTSNAARNELLNNAVGTILLMSTDDYINKAVNKMVTKRTIKNVLEGYKKVYINTLIDTLYDNLGEVKYIKQEFKRDIFGDNINFSNMEAIISNNPTIQINNVFACIKELIDVDGGFFKQISIVPQIAQFTKDNSIRRDEISENEDTLEDELEDIENSDENNTKDLTISKYNSHLGDINDYRALISNDLKVLFASLPVLNSTKTTVDENKKVNYDIKTNNNVGLPIYMTPQQCENIIFQKADKTNVANMIESIKWIAENIKGYEGLIKLYTICKNQPEVAYKLFSNFSRSVTETTETIVDGDEALARTSNRRVDAKTILRFNFLNDYKVAISNFSDGNLNMLREYYTKCRDIIELRKTSPSEFTSEKTDELITTFHKYLSYFIKDITEQDIINYIRNNNNNVNTAYKNLLNKCTILSQQYKESVNNYLALKKEISNVRRQIEIKTEEKNNEAVNNLNKQLQELYNTEVITNTGYNELFKLVDIFMKYKDTHISLNNKNVHGNNRSSVLNNNFINQFKEIMNNPELIIAKGKQLQRSNQYKYSNLLFPQYETINGKQVKINVSIFDYDSNGELTVSPNYKELLVSRLYDGASNFETGANASYSEMSGTDYLTSAYINFTSRENIGGKVNTAAYFSRTPSDSPNIYSHNMPKYNNIEGNKTCAKIKLTIEQEQEYVKKENELFGEGQTEEIHAKMIESKAIDILNGNYNRPIYLRKLSKNDKNAYNENALKNDTKVQFNVEFVSEGNNKESSVQYVLEGTYKNGAFYNYKIKQVLIKENSKNTALINNLKQEYKSIYVNNINVDNINVEVNPNTTIFRLHRNIFKQELINAATALYEIFNCVETVNPDGITTATVKLQEVMKDGVIVPGTLPSFRFELLNKENPTEDDKKLIKEYLNSFYENYHYVKSKKNKGEYVFGEVKDEQNDNPTYVLLGKVFNSDRFTNVGYYNGKIDTKNYGDKIIKESINFLYGGADTAFNFIIRDGKVVDIKLSEKQNQTIDKYLTEFIKDKVRHGEEQLRNIKDFVPESIYNENNRIEFILNYNLAFNNYADLFEGDSKFYSNSQNFLKRAKEIQAAGIPYGNADLYDLLGLGTSKEAIHVVKKPGSDENYVLNIAGQTIEIRNRFKAITIKNSSVNSTGSLTKHLNNKLKEIFINQGYSEVDALNKANSIMDGYKNITANDAQSYITFEEWIRRITLRGQLEEYKPLIEKIYNNENLGIDELNKFIQVQKNFYYDVEYDEKHDIYVPRQIKNAEFVLIPQLIRGTELESVYNLMKEHNIDQINTSETSKAAKRDVIELFDDNGYLIEFEDDVIKQQINNSAENYSYNNLYTQLDNPQHLNATNKAGIQIMKKILDNISVDSPIYKYKEEFINLYVENIKSSYIQLMKELGVEGNIKINNETGRIEGFNYKKFFAKLEQELLRRGLNSNMFDYVTYEEHNMFSLTKMPFYMANVDTLFQNIAQAIFNNSITRQRLPGFHGVQVTRIGWKGHTGVSKTLNYHPEVYKLITDNDDIYKQTYISKEEYNKLSDNKKSKYQLTTAPYIEILLPKANFNFKTTNKNGNRKTDEQLLQELKSEHLDEIIGYRMPTEGKQSVSIMKVVGFVPDECGSTIIVPDEWVAQTGADFDVDSIYGICYNTFIDKKGKIRRVRYKDFDKIEQQNRFKELQENQNKAYNNLPENIQKEIKKIHNDFVNDDNISKQENYLNKINYEIEKLENVSSQLDFDSKEYKLLDEYYDNLYELQSELDETVIAEAEEDNSNIELNSKQARDNQILKNMISILGNDLSLEENLSRSNFEDIIEARNSILELTKHPMKQLRKDRSPYDIFNQADFQYDAMSGAMLKAFSVKRDTFCSICNTARATINSQKQIKITYKLSTLKTTLEELKKSFDNIKVNGDYVTITHINLGWSNDFHNVDGKLITTYTSETTAHILDAIKEGNIPNVNEFTFQLYKLFPDIGSNYNVAVAFMMQPVVTRICEEYNKSNSIYCIDDIDPIHNVLKELIIKYCTINNLTYNENELFDSAHCIAFINNIKDNKLQQLIGNDIEINEEVLIDRLSNTSPVEEKDTIQQDLAIAVKFYDLYNIASKINDYTMVCNPDKFGAKQTLFATREILDKIEDIKLDENPILLSNGKNLISSIYTDNPKDSVYSILNAFLQYATKTSVNVNTSLFPTQRENFRRFIYSINRDYKTLHLSEDAYNDFQKYVLSYYYNQVSFIRNEVTFEDGKFKVIDGSYAVAEKERIFGYNKSSEPTITKIETVNRNGENIKELVKVPFTVNDISNPTKEEIDNFRTLSPAQKVRFIKQYITGISLFTYITPNVTNYQQYGKNHIATQTLTIADNATDIEILFKLFNDAFNNTNPLIALTAADVLKYAFVVEGFRYKHNSINKIIPNDILLNSIDENGTDFINEMNDYIETSTNGVITNDIKESYYRSHHKTSNYMYSIYLSNKEKQNEFHNNEYVVTETIKNANGNTSRKRFNTGLVILSIDSPLLKKLDITILDYHDSFTWSVNTKYVNIIEYGKNTLYHIVPDTTNENIYLYPLNDLEESEFGQWSANSENNNYPSKDYYNYLINKINNNVIQNDLTDSIVSIDTIIKYKKDSSYNKSYNTREVKQIELDINSSQFDNTRNDIINKFNEDFTTVVVYTRDIKLHTSLYNNPTVQTILINNEEVDVKLERVNLDLNHKDLYKNPTLVEIVNSENPYNVISATRLNKQKPKVKHSTVRTANVANSANTMSNNLFNITLGAMSIIANESRKGNKNAIDVIGRLKYSGITKETFTDRSIDALPIICSYISKACDDINDRLDNFYVIGDFAKNVTDEDIIEKIKIDETLRDAYIKLLVEARALFKQFGAFKDLKINFEDENLTTAFNTMQSKLMALFNNKELYEAETKLANDVLPLLSNNPLVRAKLINVLENFNELSKIEMLLHDTAESTNTLVQIMINEVEKDITYKEMLAKKESIKFKKHCDDIIARAKKDGLGIDFNKMIDKNGKWIPEYNQAFKDKLKELQTKVQNDLLAFDKLCRQDNYNKEEYKKLRNAWIESKFEYDLFKFNYTNQLLDDSYYATQLAEEYEMLKKHKDIFCDYIGLQHQRNILFNKKSVSGLTDANELKLKEIESQIAKLQSEYSIIIESNSDDVIAGTFAVDSSATDEQIKHIRALKQYVSTMKKLKDEYFERTPKFSFESAYTNNLNKVLAHDAGSKDVTDAEYHKAKQWLTDNVRYIRSDESYKQLNAAYEALKNDPYGTVSKTGEFKRIYNELPNLYDEFGVIDATKLNEEQITSIKKIQESKHFINGGAYNETYIINCGEQIPFVFTSDFYKFGINLDSEKNPEYLNRVREINAILKKYITAGQLNIQQISIKDLKELSSLFDIIDDIKGHSTHVKEDALKIKKFIEKNIDFVNNTTQYEKDRIAAENKGKEYYDAFLSVAFRLYPAFTSDGTKLGNDYDINRMLYGSMRPKGYNEEEYKRILAKDKKDRTAEEKERIKFVDETRTKALQTIHDNCVYVTTRYYQNEYAKHKLNDNPKDFEKWYDANHIYNPYLHKMEPIACWMRLSNDPADYQNVNVTFEHEPRYQQTEVRAKEDKLNKNYKGNKSSIASNYRTKPIDFNSIKMPYNINDTNSIIHHRLIKSNLNNIKNNTNYDNTELNLNQYEQEIKDYFKSIIEQYVKTNSGKEFINEGYVPLRAQDNRIDGKTILKETAKMVGWTFQNKDDIGYTPSDRVDYAFDPELTMPMLATLAATDMLNFEQVEPRRINYNSDEEFEKAKKDYEEAKEKYNKELEETQQSLIDRDFISVMEDFINKAGTYNAIQDNKFKLYYTKNMLENTLGYKRQAGTNKLQLIDPNHPDKGYAQTVDDNAVEQLNTYIRRRVLNQFKEDNSVFTRTANLMQSLTSAKFMVGNVMGGIANVTLGNVNILMESIAKDYFGASDWLAGRLMYDKGAVSYIKDMYANEATSVQSALIQWMNVVDFDDYAEVVRTANLKEKAKRARNLLYAPNSAGEHRMQNSVMFGLMYSHKVIPANKTKSGKVEIMNEQEYLRNNRELVLQEILDNSPELKKQYDIFIKYSMNNIKEKEKYATFRDDLTSKFVRLYLGNAANEYFEKVKSKNDESKKEFDSFESLVEQYDLQDGYLSFKSDKTFGQIDEEDAIKLTAQFRNKVISVNKEIHGVYDRLGAASIEAKWYGSIIMQYKKHLPMGIAKHWRRLGYYNETRNSVEKGSCISLIDFVTMPFRDKAFIKELKANTNATDEEIQYLTSFQNLVSTALDVITTYKLCWKSLPEYERNNIAKMLGELIGVTSAICIAIATHAIADDDDEDSLLYNLAIYEADRLASETVMYHPLGLISEGKKLWSSPIAMQNGVEELVNGLGFCVQAIWQGDEFNWTYKTGLYAGENKLKTKTLKQIPVVRQIYNFKRLNKNNKYYKYDKNMLSIIPVKEIGDNIVD